VCIVPPTVHCARPLRRMSRHGACGAAALSQELSLLTQMGWSKCMGSTCMGSTCAACSSSEAGANGDDAAAGGSAPVDAAVQLALDASLELGAEAAEAARAKLQLSVEEWLAWEQRKDALMEERQRIREQLKQRTRAPRPPTRAGRSVCMVHGLVGLEVGGHGESAEAHALTVA
jgi:hypothetical protein